MKRKFEMDNTSGYTQEQLNELNSRLATAIEAEGIDPDNVDEHDALQWLSENVQREYDTEIS